MIKSITRVAFSVTLAVALITASSQFSNAGDDCCPNCGCEQKPEKKCFLHCCCCSKLNIPDPPRGQMAFSFVGVPSTALATPIRFNANQQPNQDQATRFSVDDSLDDVERLLKFIESNKDKLEPAVTPSAQVAEPESVEKRLDEIERTLARITRLLDEQSPKPLQDSNE